MSIKHMPWIKVERFFRLQQGFILIEITWQVPIVFMLIGTFLVLFTAFINLSNEYYYCWNLRYKSLEAIERITKDIKYADILELGPKGEILNLEIRRNFSGNVHIQEDCQTPIYYSYKLNPLGTRTESADTQDISDKLDSFGKATSKLRIIPCGNQCYIQELSAGSSKYMALSTAESSGKHRGESNLASPKGPYLELVNYVYARGRR